MNDTDQKKSRTFSHPTLPIDTNNNGGEAAILSTAVSDQGGLHGHPQVVTLGGVARGHEGGVLHVGHAPHHQVLTVPRLGRGVHHLDHLSTPTPPDSGVQGLGVAVA